MECIHTMYFHGLRTGDCGAYHREIGLRGQAGVSDSAAYRPFSPGFRDRIALSASAVSHPPPTPYSLHQLAALGTFGNFWSFFLVVTAKGRSSRCVEAKDATQHATRFRTAPHRTQEELTWPTVSLVLRLGTPPRQVSRV